MGLEITDNIKGLNPDWPSDTDLVSDGDDHLRLIKKTLKETFPNINGTVFPSSNEIVQVTDKITIDNSNKTIDMGASSINNISASDNDTSAQTRDYNDSRYMMKGGTFNTITFNGQLKTGNSGNSYVDSIKATTKLIFGDNSKQTTIVGNNITIIPEMQLNNVSFEDLAYPIGTIYTNTSSALNPSSATLLGFGTWELLGPGRVTVGISTEQEFNSAGKTGGEKKTTVSAAQIPSHHHTINNIPVYRNSGNVLGGGTRVRVPWTRYGGDGRYGQGNWTTQSTGGNESHNNLQPYIVVYRWIRVA